jgi:hypothetical protein
MFFWFSFKLSVSCTTLTLWTPLAAEGYDRLGQRPIEKAVEMWSRSLDRMGHPPPHSGAPRGVEIFEGGQLKELHSMIIKARIVIRWSSNLDLFQSRQTA